MTNSNRNYRSCSLSPCGRPVPAGQLTMRKLLLLSGGMDSSLCLYKVPGIELCVGFDYGQPHVIELDYAKEIATACGVEFRRVGIPKMPRIDDAVFPARNAVLLSMAASIAVSQNLDAIVIGCNMSDAARFPDCRDEFIAEIGKALSVYGVSVLAPLLAMTKADILSEARSFGIPSTWTCYQPNGKLPCGECYACLGLENARVQS